MIKRKLGVNDLIVVKKNNMKKLKEKLYGYAMKSSVRKWALSLTGWKWWAWQVVVGLLCFSIAEVLLNKLGMTIIPWK